jgi:hypothetical protein
MECSLLFDLLYASAADALHQSNQWGCPYFLKSRGPVFDQQLVTPDCDYSRSIPI